MAHWQKILQELTLHPQLHGRFLNMLSLLEYIGARKIMKSQKEVGMNPVVLTHIAEEVRHAQVFKKLALKVAGPTVMTFEEEALLCGREGRTYFQTIDRTAQDVVGSDHIWLNYLLTTLIVEERAQNFYSFYDELLTQLGLGGPLKAIVREEVNHLKEVKDFLSEDSFLKEEDINRVRDVEQSFFNDIFMSIEEHLQKARKSASEDNRENSRENADETSVDFTSMH